MGQRARSTQPNGIRHKLVGILFLDIKGFSRLSHIQLSKFVTNVMTGLSDCFDEYRKQLLDLNTWGDAIFAVSDDPVAIARLALDVRDFFRRTNFEKSGLPTSLRSRISLHAGTVFCGTDPIRQRSGVIGVNVNLAARVEPTVVPGEVWATADFKQLLWPHTEAEQLAFDDIGVQELAKDFGTYHLFRLRRADDAAATSDELRRSLRRATSHLQVSRAFDLVAIGALNTDYIATATQFRKIKSDMVAEHEAMFEIGHERVASQKEVHDVISLIGKHLLTVSHGGSAFNTVHALARAVPELRMAFVGVAGATEAGMSFADLCAQMHVDTSCIKKSPTEAGMCVSYISRGERSMLTTPGANTEIADYLIERRHQISDLIKRARIVHVTSLFDSKSPQVLAEILQDAKSHNPWLQVSFDPGYDWVRRIKTGEQAEPIREILNLATFLFVNQTEFELLSSDLGIGTDHQLAERIFQHLSSQAILILLKRYDEIRIFHRLHRELKEASFKNKPLSDRQIEDATGAGDVFAAGLFAAMMIPGFELRDGIQLGLNMVRSKLRSGGTTGFAQFANIVESYRDEVYARPFRTVLPDRARWRLPDEVVVFWRPFRTCGPARKFEDAGLTIFVGYSLQIRKSDDAPAQDFWPYGAPSNGRLR